MRAFALLTFLLLTAVPASADCQMTTSDPEVDTGSHGDGVPRYYVDNDPCHMCIFSIWVYEESNGIDGLQRGDEVKDDTCGGTAGQHDTIIL